MHPTFEPLETRRMMSASLKSGVLRVAGGAGNDRIALSLDKGRIMDEGWITVTRNGVREGRFASSAVKSISIDAGAGNDTVSVAPGIKQAPRISGGAGADTIDYSASTHGIYANIKTGRVVHYKTKAALGTLASIEIIRGSAYPDCVDAHGGLLAAYGKGGKDDLYAFGNCRASLFGGDGDDWLMSAPGAPNLIDGGAGADTMDYSDHFNELGGVDVSMDGVANDGLFGETDNVRGVEDVMGTPRNDRIVGDAAANRLSGLGGDDLIYGGGGDDRLSGGAGNDSAYGQDGNDSLNGGDGNDDLAGGAGDDEIYGMGGDDHVIGNAGFDRLFGNDGDDNLYANNNDRDALDGGAGYDVALVDRSVINPTKFKDTWVDVETPVI